MDKDIAIKVTDLHKEFVLPQHRNTSIKQTVVNITRKNGKTTQKVLDGVSFEVKHGDFYGIVGRNGSGKSTLLKILAGVYSPTRGGLWVNGNLTPFIELGVGFKPELSGRDNVFLNGALLGFTHKQMEAMYDSIVEFAELEPFMDQKLKNYSSGMQVRLAFSIAIRAESDILLLDEVLAVGDAAFQQKCYDYFEKLKAENKTVVFVTHDMGAVRRFCNRALYLKDGNIVQEGDPSDIADLYTEGNIGGASQQTEEQVKLSDTHKVTAQIAEQDNKSLRLRIKYASDDKEKMYIGFSLVKDGVAFAEIGTAQDHPLIGSGEVFYTLDKEIFNAGLYRIAGVSLFRIDNRQLLAFDKRKNEFAIKGNDPMRGSAIKLEDTWVYGKN